MKIIQMEQYFGFTSSSGVRSIEISGEYVFGEKLDGFVIFTFYYSGRCEDTSKQFIFEYIFLASY